jgi:hypothetical protein
MMKGIVFFDLVFMTGYFRQCLNDIDYTGKGRHTPQSRTVGNKIGGIGFIRIRWNQAKHFRLQRPEKSGTKDTETGGLGSGIE